MRRLRRHPRRPGDAQTKRRALKGRNRRTRNDAFAARTADGQRRTVLDPCRAPSGLSIRRLRNPGRRCAAIAAPLCPGLFCLAPSGPNARRVLTIVVRYEALESAGRSACDPGRLAEVWPLPDFWPLAPGDGCLYRRSRGWRVLRGRGLSQRHSVSKGYGHGYPSDHSHRCQEVSRCTEAEWEFACRSSL